MQHVSDAQVITAIKAKLGFQEKIIYCKDCVSSVPNPDSTDRALTLMCTRVDLVPFAVGKMKTCSRSSAFPAKADYPVEPGPDPQEDADVFTDMDTEEQPEE